MAADILEGRIVTRAHAAAARRPAPRRPVTAHDALRAVAGHVHQNIHRMTPEEAGRAGELIMQLKRAGNRPLAMRRAIR